MNTDFAELQLKFTRALIKFIRDHDGHIDPELAACQTELENGNIDAAIRHAKMVKPHGMSGITDWYPKPLHPNEDYEYNEAIMYAIANEWCRVISLSLDRRPVPELTQKGALDAPVRSNGWVRCPFCATTFASYSKSSWDGNVHLSCGVRLRLIPEGDPNAA